MKPEKSLHKRPFTQRKAPFPADFVDVAVFAATCVLPLQGDSVLGSKMIRRCGISLLFAILGIASLLFLSVIDARFCDRFPAIQYCSDRFHGCGLDCSQSWPLSEQIKAFFFFFGPSIVFAGTAFF
jgi:hypothetical protein